jgi:hypothetical protein
MSAEAGPDIVIMNSLNPGRYSRVALTPHKRLLGSIYRPQRLVIELCCIPDDFIEELRNRNGMTRWTRAVVLECTATRVGYMAHMVRAVKIYSIPTSENVSFFLVTHGHSHVGNRKFAMIPAGHGLVGNEVVSPERVMGV